MSFLPLYDDLAKQLAPIVLEAGRLLLQIQASICDVQQKNDGTPSCPADRLSEEFIVTRLRELYPSIAIISEEQIRDSHIAERFFLIDPLDGTADFIAGGKEFCINIALIEHGRPCAAVIHAPAFGRTWLAGETAFEVFSKTSEAIPVRTRVMPSERVVALGSSRYGDSETSACLDALQHAERRTLSSALKFCFIAEGQADIYIRHGRTMEWDTAAGDLILSRAGGIVTDFSGQPLIYGKTDTDFANAPFLAVGDHDFLPELLNICRSALRHL